MVWLLLALVIFLAIAGLGAMRAPGRRGLTRLGPNRGKQNDGE